LVEGEYENLQAEEGEKNGSSRKCSDYRFGNVLPLSRPTQLILRERKVE
jgi:hypothetical protein